MLDAGDLFERYGTLLRSGGTNQLQRALPALAEDYIRPDERGVSQLLTQMGAGAAQLQFHGLSGQVAGNWAPLLDELRDSTGAILSDEAIAQILHTRSDLPPQLALIFAFLKAFEHVQADFNQLPARHLAHYFENVLGLDRRAAVPDRAHVVFELSRTAKMARLQAGHLLDAGTDAQGQPLKYALEREVVITPAKLAQVQHSVTTRDTLGRLRLFRGTPPDEGTWPTFGADPFGTNPGAEAMVEAAPGFAVADPVLRMAEGTRDLTLTLHMPPDPAAPPAQLLSNDVDVMLTGAEGWMAPGTSSVVLEDDPAGQRLVINLNLGADMPAVTDFDQALHADPDDPNVAPVAKWPVLRCLVRPQTGKAEVLAALTATSVEIAVEVNGITDLIVQNDQRTLDAAKPMALFTQRPKVGSTFYIGAQEVFVKRLSTLSVNLTWEDRPEDLMAHYHGYFDSHDGVLTSLMEPSFTAVVDLLDGRSWSHRLTGPAGVFRLFQNGQDSSSITFSGAAIDTAFADSRYEAAPDLPAQDRYDISTKRGFIRLQLTGPTNDDLANFSVPYARDVPFTAFGHDAFARRYAAAAIALALYDPAAPGAGPEPELPNEPYTPQLSSLSLGYEATVAFDPADIQAHGRLFTIGAAGYATAGPDVRARLAPAITPQAELALGFEGFEAPGTLSILFQLDEGTAQVADPPAPADITWAYLRDDHWITLPPSAIVVDETLGFQRSGILAVAIGHDATTDHTQMPAGLTWLRATLAKPAEAVARTVALHAQAASVVLSPPDGATLDTYADHLRNGLPADTITRLDPRDGAIKKLSQPYPSFGGRAGEDDPGFFKRTSERLRHRARAVTLWDFEHLVLEQFPDVFKVRALPHSDTDAGPAVSNVALVIIPNLLNSQSSNRLEPRAGETLMEDIRRFVSTQIASPFAAVNVIHPVYERLRVLAHVAFRPGFDPGFYADQLDQDLQRFLSPWAFEEGRDIVFGTRIYRSELLKFVEDRDYVDYVTRFDVYHAFEGPPRAGVGFMEVGLDFVVGSDPVPAVQDMTIGDDFIVGHPQQTATSTRPEAVLVSHPSHIIEPVFPGTESCSDPRQFGIGHMIVGIDFNVTEP